MLLMHEAKVAAHTLFSCNAACADIGHPVDIYVLITSERRQLTAPGSMRSMDFVWLDRSLRQRIL
jgi:hypothetical protein